MFIVFCDGSTKLKEKCVVTSLVVVECNSDGIVQQVIYCAKKTYRAYYRDSVHEFLAILDGFKAIELLNLHDRSPAVRIVSDSMEWTTNLNSQGLDKDLNHLWKPGITVEWANRTTLGINVADFLNKEAVAWTNNLDKKYLASQMKKLLRKSYLYNISSKHF